MSIYTKINAVKKEIRIPKNEWNPEGFKYRSLELVQGIIKPLCIKNGLTYYFTDDVKQVGPYNYIETTLVVIDMESGENVSVKAVAREEESATCNMPQIPMVSGAASTYAHKRALENTFAIDDGAMDPDAFGTPQVEQLPPEFMGPEPGPVFTQAPPQGQQMTLPIMGQAPAMPQINAGAQPQPMVPHLMRQQQSQAPSYQAPVMPQMPNGAPRMPMPQPRPEQAPAMPQMPGPEQTVSQAPVMPQQAPPVQTKRVLTVSAINYDPANGRSILSTDAGEISFHAFDKDRQWRSESVDLRTIDIKKLYESGCKMAGCRLEDYTGMGFFG